MNVFETKFLQAFPLKEWQKHKICIATSGGPDSVALLLALSSIAATENLKKNILVTTVDHQLRGEESTEDANFVERLAIVNEFAFEKRLLNPEELERETKRLGSLEDAARVLRYQELIKSAKKFGARYIVTAHHLGDQLETILFRLFRGTGIEGLRGMMKYRKIDESLLLVRPMLQIKKDEILQYLEERNQNYRVDSSNTSPQIIRNRIRRELLPLLDSIFPHRWEKALLRLAQQNDSLCQFFSDNVEQLERALSRFQTNSHYFNRLLTSMRVDGKADPEYIPGKRVDLPLETLSKVPNEILIQYFRKLWKKMEWPLGSMGQSEWTRLALNVKSKRATQQFPGNVALLFLSSSVLRLERFDTVNQSSNSPSTIIPPNQTLCP